MSRLLTALLWTLLPLSPLWGQRPTTAWSLEPELRIGSIDDGPYALSGISHIVVSPRSGAVFVAQYGRIGVFDAEGRHLRTFGRRGEGPGEFSRLVGLGWSGDRLTALKSSTGHAMHFTEEGGLIDDRRLQVDSLPDGTPLRIGIPLASLDGGFYLWRARMPRVPNERPRDPLLRIDADGEILMLDRVAREPEWREGPVMGLQRLTGPSLVAAHPRGIALVVVHQHAPSDEDDAHFRVRKVEASGRVLYARTYTFPPRQVPSSYADSVIREGVEIISSYRSYPNLEEMLRRNLHFPRFQPPVTEVLLAVDGSVWMRREDAQVDRVGWTILDNAGDFVGQLSVPADLKIAYVDGDTVWGIERDALGVEYAVRFRIRR